MMPKNLTSPQSRIMFEGGMPPKANHRDAATIARAAITTYTMPKANVYRPGDGEVAITHRTGAHHHAQFPSIINGERQPYFGATA